MSIPLLIASFLIIGTVAAVPAVTAPTRGGRATGGRIHACELLTRELVMKFTDAESKRVIGMVPPTEEDLGAAGPFCEHGGITLQIDPFAARQALDKAIGKEWVAVPGVGDAAKFFNDKNRWANLIVWTGAHHFTVQIGVPMGASGESLKPNTIGVANAIIPKLR